MLRIFPKPAVFFCRCRPQFYWDVVGTRLPLVLATGIPLMLSLLIPYQWLPLIDCTLLKLSGIPCPFCGFTRAIWAISAGEWAYATHSCPLAWLVYLLLLGVFTYNTTVLLSGAKLTKRRIFPTGIRWTRWAAGIGLVLLLLNWGYRLALGSV
jgi:hypothetical protein